MSMPNPYMQYQQTAVIGTKPGELTLMLYNGLVKHLKLSLISLEQKCYNESHNALVRCQEVIAYLKQTLDFQYELSQNLADLYNFMTQRLMEANIKKDSKIAKEVLEMVEDLRDTWQQALKMV